MSKVVVRALSLSLDGFGAGPDQSLEAPMGKDSQDLHAWFRPTDTFLQMMGKSGEKTGVDAEFAKKSMGDLGAWIMGRNMFGPVRGPWPDMNWKGWWGEEPPYHCPVFVLTHHARAPLEMKGGTVFHFVTDGIESALKKAKEAAKGKDIRIGGGVDTVRQYLSKGLIDELHLAYSPTFLGRGESLLQGLDLTKLGYKVTESKGSDRALHVIVSKLS